MTHSRPRNDVSSGAGGAPAGYVPPSGQRTPRVVVRVVVAAAVVAVIAGAVLHTTRVGRAAESRGGETAERSWNVRLAEVRNMQFERALDVQGSVRAKYFAMVSPRVAGVLEAIRVDEGDTVKADETELFQTDALKLSKAVELRGHEVNVAENSLREKRASLERYQAEFEKAEYDWNRYRDLHERGLASNDEYEAAETSYRTCTAMVKYAQALIDLADAQLGQARSALAMAAKDLADARVVAPLSGRVVRRYQEPGEMGSPGQAVLRIEDPSVVEVAVLLPAQFFGDVIPDQTKMRVRVSGTDIGEHAVTYRSPTIDQQMRTFEVRCVLRDPPAVVAPGAMANVHVVFERREGLGVPRDAIQERRDGPVVFRSDGARARLVAVQVGLETDGWVQATADDLRVGVPVVVDGAYFLNPDAPIRVLQETR